MFTGLVEEIGRVAAVKRSADYRRIRIQAEKVLEEVKKGDSISVDGACQTVVAFGKDYFEVESLGVTLEKTTLGSLRQGAPVNLERALSLSSRLDGHLVQGHVDGTGRVTAVRKSGKNIYLSVRITKDLSRYCVSEGSITIDGVSLTVSKIAETEVTVNIIPTTWADTALQYCRAGSVVNIEVDMIARYLEKLVGKRRF